MSQVALINNENGSLFVQPGGPNHEPVWLGCYEVDDVSENRGGLNLLYCIDKAGEWAISGSYDDPPDVITFNLGTYAGKRKELLDTAICPIPVYLQLRLQGYADLFTNWERLWIIDVQRITGRTISNVVKRSEKNEIMLTYEASAEPFIQDVTRPQGYRVSVVETENLNSMAFDPTYQCAKNGQARRDACDIGYAVADSDGIAAANVIGTLTGANWAALAAQPFAVAENISGSVLVPLGRGEYRLVVARGSTDAGNPAEIAYSDDNGATWTLANVGSVNGQFVAGQHGLFALDRWNIWAVMDDGYVYYSNDGAQTWTLQDAGVASGGSQLNSVYFKSDYVGVAVGAADSVILTVDGGDTWSAATATGGGNGLLDVTHNGLLWWVTDDGGSIHYSIDDADNWDERTGWTGSQTGTVDAVSFSNKYFGMIAHTDGSSVGHVLITADGGFNWERISFPTAVQLNDIYVCGNDLAYVVGDTQGGTGFLAKIQIDTPA